MKLSICIVNYKTKDLTLKAIQSIYDYYKYSDFEIILLDNTPGGNIQPEDLRSFENLKFIQNFSNSYFSGGFNQAAREAVGKYILLMSSDIILIDDSISKLMNFLESNSNVGAVEASLLNQRNGQIVKTGSMELTRIRDFIRSHNFLKKIFYRIYNNYSYSDWDRKENKEVEVITNAFMMIKRDLFFSLGGLEEAMKLYFTEERLCDLIRAKGLKLFHIGEAIVQHYESASTNESPSKLIKHIYKTDKKFYFFLKNLS